MPVKLVRFWKSGIVWQADGGIAGGIASGMANGIANRIAGRIARWTNRRQGGGGKSTDSIADGMEEFNLFF